MGGRARPNGRLCLGFIRKQREISGSSQWGISPFPISTPPHPENAQVKMGRQKGKRKQELRLPCLKLEYLLARLSQC